MKKQPNIRTKHSPANKGRFILTLLDTEEQEKDLDFADRLFNLLQSLIEKGDRQERQMAQLNGQLTEMMAYLTILTEVATSDEASGISD